MKFIRTIDLWTEQYINQYECFHGAFVDGFDGENIFFDEYKIVKHCNCKITVSDEKINIHHKHQAIVFYKKKRPVRLMVINGETDIERCITSALEQRFLSGKLKDVYEKFHIGFQVIDMGEKPIDKERKQTEEIDVGSCDRWNLLYQMLQGSYTESDTSYGNYESDHYEFIPNISIMYELVTDAETFVIEHRCAFINTIQTRIIPIQENSLLTGVFPS